MQYVLAGLPAHGTNKTRAIRYCLRGVTGEETQLGQAYYDQDLFAEGVFISFSPLAQLLVVKGLLETLVEKDWISSAPPELSLTSRADARRWVENLRATGITIPPDVQSLLFIQ